MYLWQRRGNEESRPIAKVICEMFCEKLRIQQDLDENLNKAGENKILAEARRQVNQTSKTGFGGDKDNTGRTWKHFSSGEFGMKLRDYGGWGGARWI
jgi:hypothetical protein